MVPSKCLNCEEVLSPDMQYCFTCGQKAHTHPLSFHEILHDTVHYVTHADTSIFRLLRQLAIQPGTVAREYVYGKRKKYFKPLNFFLIVAGIVVFMTTAFYQPNDSTSRNIESAAARVENPAQKERLLQMANRTRKVNVITGKYSNVINMVATPFMTLFFWLAYKRKFNYVESLVANMYFIAFVMLFYAIVFVPLLHMIPGIGTYLIALFFLFEIVYRGLAYRQLSETKGTKGIVKAYAVSLLISLLWIALTVSLIMSYVRGSFPFT
jgi:Protein of unknown function (DUF3667)